MDVYNELIKFVALAAKAKKIDIMLIGAYARDFWCKKHRITVVRSTKDIDFACQVMTWGEYYSFVAYLKSQEGIKGDEAIDHRLWLNDEICFDLVPFGAIMTETGMIQWESKREKEFSVLGFDAARDDAFILEKEEYSIRIIQPYWLAFLKLLSYTEMPFSREKDLEDFYLLAKEYLYIYGIDKFFQSEDKFIQSIFEAKDFDFEIAGAKLIYYQCRNSKKEVAEQIQKKLSDFNVTDVITLVLARVAKIDPNFASQILKGIIS